MGTDGTVPSDNQCKYLRAGLIESLCVLESGCPRVSVFVDSSTRECVLLCLPRKTRVYVDRGALPQLSLDSTGPTPCPLTETPVDTRDSDQGTWNSRDGSRIGAS